MKIVRMTKVEYGKIIAFFDIETSEGLVIKGFKLIRMDEENIFVGSPSKKDGSDDKYNDIVIYMIWANCFYIYIYIYIYI